MNCGRNEKSGMPTANTSISNAMRELGCEVDHLYVDDYPSPVRIPSLKYLLFGLATVGRVRALEAERGPYDVVQISSGDGYVAPRLRRDIRGRRRLVVAQCHGLEHRYWDVFLGEVVAGRLRTSLKHRLHFGKLRLKQAELSIRRADLLNCHTAADGQYAIDRGWKRPGQVSIMPNGIDPSWIGAVAGYRPRAERVLFCGSWTWMKGPRVLAAAFERLAADRPYLRLTVLAGGVDQATVLGAFDASVRHRVTVMPALPHEAVLEQARRHDMFLATSLFEGFGTVVPEAMAAGLPVVASAAGAAPEFIDSGRNGHLVPVGDVEATVAACATVLDANANERQAMGAAAMRRVEGITWPVIARAQAERYAAELAKVADQR
ncbi:MAG: glycosyltransferase family 1 protein [Dehalococcoidia bacterium]|nr:MAG: glycosyltransferase family 1 protein [Dehalococcoidia bacterium]